MWGEEFYLNQSVSGTEGQGGLIAILWKLCSFKLEC